MDKRSAPAGYYLLLVLLLFQALSGLTGGILLVSAPSGSTLHMPPGLLDGSPFENFFIPGLILLLLLGLLPVAVTLAVWKKYRLARTWSFLTGLILIIWISVQIVMTGYRADPPLQAIYGTIGILIIITVSSSSVRRYLENE
ncbi:MAG: hypothetical protein R3222_02680 [Balneolaceae bacterium]|nr:hypothetical protein [Balneolaceae bacterium]